jgi:hypothetical protein
MVDCKPASLRIWFTPGQQCCKDNMQSLRLETVMDLEYPQVVCHMHAYMPRNGSFSKSKVFHTVSLASTCACVAGDERHTHQAWVDQH